MNTSVSSRRAEYRARFTVVAEEDAFPRLFFMELDQLVAGSADNLKEMAFAADFPQYPGEDVLAHNAVDFQEKAENTLASLGLLAVVHGEEPASVRAIVDVDLSLMPELPLGHRDYHRRMESRIKIQAQNRANAERRYTLTMEAWTKIYTLLKKSTETTAPVLSRELREMCDLAKVRKMTGGYFDGPRAWRMILRRLHEKRSEADKDFYRQAERLQRASTLPDGCQAAEYSKRALAFLIHIKPNLAQSYDDDDTTQYLINLMLKCLREGGRRIKHELTLEGRQHDFMHVIKRCRALVQEEQKGTTPTPAFVVDDGMGAYDIAALANTTGMLLSLSGSNGTPMAAAAQAGKFCDKCPHKEGVVCFLNPSYAGPPPLSVYSNKERWKGIVEGRAENARKMGLSSAPMKLPSKKDVDDYVRARKARRDKRRGGPADGAGGASVDAPAVPGAAAADAAAVAEWRASLTEITDESHLVSIPFDSTPPCRRCDDAYSLVSGDVMLMHGDCR